MLFQIAVISLCIFAFIYIATTSTYFFVQSMHVEAEACFAFVYVVRLGLDLLQGKNCL